jgi:hypothetical protein
LKEKISHHTDKYKLTEFGDLAENNLHPPPTLLRIRIKKIADADPGKNLDADYALTELWRAKK